MLHATCYNATLLFSFVTYDILLHIFKELFGLQYTTFIVNNVD